MSSGSLTYNLHEQLLDTLAYEHDTELVSSGQPIRRKFFGLDEKGTMEQGEDRIVVASVTDRKRYASPQMPCKKERPSQVAGDAYGDFSFIVLKPRMIAIARDFFPPPSTTYEKSLESRSLYYQFKLQARAMARLLQMSDFNPWTDIAYVDSFGNRESLEDDLRSSLSGIYGKAVPIVCVNFEHSADVTIPIVTQADRNARRIAIDVPKYNQHRVRFTESDVIQLGLEAVKSEDMFYNVPRRGAPVWH